MSYDFDEPVIRKGTLSVKWNPAAIENITGNPNAEPFWVADMDFKAAPEIQQAAKAAAATGVYGYPHFDGVDDAFRTFVRQRHGLDVPASHIAHCEGLLDSIALLMELLTKEGDGVIIPFPAYYPFVRITQSLGRTVLRWPLAYDRTTHRFSLDWDAFEALAPKAKLCVFCSPHNPSGLEFTPAELERLCALAKQHHLPVVCDEIHADLSYGNHTTLYAANRKVGARVVTCMAPSKTFNIAGEHFSVVISEDTDLLAALNARMDALCIHESSYFSTTCAVAAYRHGLPWLKELVAYLEGNADFIASYLREHCPDLVFVKPRASFIGLIDCAAVLPLVERDAQAHPALYDPARSPSGGVMSRFFGQRAGVACNDGTWFGGDAYRAFVRFNYGVRRARVEAALQAMTAAVEALKG